MPFISRATKGHAPRKLSPAEELEQLCLRPRVGEDQPRHLSTGDRELIGNLFYFTNVAIVIHWLRLLEHNSPENQGIAQLLTDFEELTFSAIPEKHRLLAVEHLNSLMKLTIELQAIADDESMSKAECSSKMLGWCRKWLGTVSADPDFVYRVGIADNLTLLTLVHQSIGALGTNIQTILFGSQP